MAILTFDEFSALLAKAKIVCAGRGWKDDSKEIDQDEQHPPLELTMPNSRISNLSKLAKLKGGNRLEDFFSVAFVGGTYGDKRFFWTEHESVESWYRLYVDSFKSAGKGYDENGNYTEATKKKLRKMGFRPR